MVIYKWRNHTRLFTIAYMLLMVGSHVQAMSLYYWAKYDSIFEAIAANNTEACNYFINTRLDADLNQRVKDVTVGGKSYSDISPMGFALKLNRFELVDFFLRSGKCLRSNSYLEIACKNQNLALCKLLIECGVPVRKSGVLRIACEKGNHERFKLLLENGAPFAGHLREAVKGGCLEICRDLLELGLLIDPDHLCLACKNGFADVVRLLILHGADVNEIFDWNFHWEDYTCSLLIVAAANSFLEISKLLLKHDADVNFIDKKKRWTALHMWARYGEGEQLCELLLES